MVAPDLAVVTLAGELLILRADAVQESSR